MPSKRQSTIPEATGRHAGSSASAPYADLPAVNQRAWVNFLKAYKVVVEKVDKATVAASPVSLAEYELLLYVDWAGGRIRFIDLAKLTLLSQSQISRRIDSLQARGYVLRESTNTDRRATFAVMTPAGLAAFTQSQEPFIRSLQDNFFNLIPADKLETFADLLALLIQDPGFVEKNDEILLQANAVNRRRRSS